MKWIFPLLILLALCSTTQNLWAQALCVKSTSATLHSEPRSSSAATWVVGRYTPLLRLERKGPWYKVQDMDGDVHWVAHESVTSDFRCLAVKVGATQLHQGPSKQTAVVERPVVDRYTSFKRLENADDWYQVEDVNGVKGWLHETSIWRPTMTQSISF
jgi:SH3-like domain-containing protein